MRREPLTTPSKHTGETMIKDFFKKKLLFNFDKYFKKREAYFKTKNRLRKMFLLYWIKKQNEKQNADIYIDSEMKEDVFKSKPVFNPHGINGIVIASGAKIGSNCRISHQVTIGRSMGGCPTIGDNVYIGPGAKIFGDIKIGNNVRIGANCPVFFDVPDNAAVVLPKPRVIIKEEGYEYYTLKEKDN